MKNLLLHLLPCFIFAIGCGVCAEFNLNKLSGTLALCTVLWFLFAPNYLE
jgi:hypothetical protein